MDICKGITLEASCLRRLFRGIFLIERTPMPIEQRIDNLIAAGWYVLDSDFDPAALQHWRKQAFHCIEAMLGSDHVTTKDFENLVSFGSWAHFTE